jgi:GNAT superfamily N-acetyltransferase
MRSGPEPFDSPEVAALCAAQQAEMNALYGEADIGPVREAPMFEPPDGVFLVVRDAGRPVACGGVARFDELRGELKRMYVVPDARGRGLGRLLLDELERHARTLGYASLVLETGDRQAAALALYRRAGFVRRPCWPPYDSRALSLCLEKALQPPSPLPQ